MNQQTQDKEQTNKGNKETKNQPEYKDKPIQTTQDRQKNFQSKDNSCGDDVTSRPQSAQGQGVSSATKKAAEKLVAKGFKVKAYEGGIKEWSEAGLPTDK